MSSSFALLLAGSAIALAQQPVVNIGGTWLLRTNSFSATVQVVQTGYNLSGQMLFTGNPCAATASFGGSINTLFGTGLTLSTNMDGHHVSFSGGISADGNYMTGQYGGSGGGCIGRGPYNWVASRASSTILPTIAGVTNAASGATGPISPGEIISIFANASISPIGPATALGLQLDGSGKVANSLGGVRVRFLDIDTYAPLIFVSAGQINAAVPYEVAGLTDVKIQVEYLGQGSTSMELQVGATAPGMFTASGTGVGQGAILNQDGSANGPTHPAPRGSIVVLFLTGGGQTTPAGITGRVTAVSPLPPITPRPIAPVTVRINGQPATILFSGEAPDMISGVLQVNVEVPTSVSPGVVPIQAFIGGKAAQSGVTLALH